MKMGELFTRHTEGKEFNIPGVDGKPSGEKITMRFAGSDEGRAGRYIAKQALPDMVAGKTDVERSRASDRAVAIALSHLVVSWTLEDECTLKNAEEFLYNAPHVLDWADGITSEPSSFFTKASAS